MKKRIISIALSILMLLSLYPLSAFAIESKEPVARDIILMLDISDSMKGTPFSAMKQAATNFCTQLLNSSDDNRIALVVWDYSYTTYSFSSDISDVKSTIEGIALGSGTNTAQALAVAKNLMDNDGRDQAIKNIVLLTDGIPQHGTETYNGQYSSNDSKYYAYANTAYNTAASLTSDYYLYALGFFHSLSGSKLSFAQKFLNDIQNAGYYEVTDPDQLEFTFGEVADDIVNSLKQITFTYQSGNDYTATCYFTNDYFAESSYTYNPSLATMSLSFAMSAFGSSKGGQSDYSNKSANAKKLLMDIGVPEANIETNEWFTKKPTTDSIGVIVGNMPINVNDESYTLIALAVRGGGYESEWASNFTIGSTGQHDGFDTAKNNVISFLKKYVENQGITGNVKFWITGYSRAAATANLVGGEIDNDTVISSNISYDYDDVYTYCFETPAGALTSQVKGQGKYYNIFNIINSSDPVPYVAPAAMGFGRYGIDRYLPSQESSSKYATQKAKMLEVYNSLDSTEDYVVDDFQMKKLEARNWLPGGEKISFVQDDTKNNYSQGLFLSNYVTILAKDFIKTRANYVSVYQDEIREICSVMFGCSDEQSKKMMDSIVSQAKNGWGELAWSYVWNVGINPWGTEDDALQIVSNWLKKAIKDAGITNYSESTVDAAGKDLADLMLALVVNHPNYFTTAIMNGSGLGAAHYPELCYSWLASMDKNYSEGAKAEFNNGGYRIVRINCAVDVEVVDNDGTIIASIENEQPNSIMNSSYIFGIDEDGQKYVVLPVDSDYGITITGREDDLVNYSISEYSALAGDYTRNINYFNIELKQGETLTGTIPAYSEEEIANDTPDGSNVEYTLLDPDNTVLESDSDKNGSDVSDDLFKINVISSNPEQCIVTGSGVHQYGTFAQVEAIALEGYQFDGWYRDSKLVSSDVIYRVCVTEDIELVGKFVEDAPSPVESYTVIFHDNGHGTAPASQIVLSGNKVTKPADPTEDGWIFGGWYKDSACSDALKFDFDTPVTAALDLYAKWTEGTKPPMPPSPESYTVNFNMNGHGEQVVAQTITAGNKVTKPADPTENGWVFKGWYMDAKFQKAFNFDGDITSDTTIYAKWVADSTTPTDPRNPNTGDNSHILLWLMLCIGSSVVLVGTTIIGKRKKSN